MEATSDVSRRCQMLPAPSISSTQEHGIGSTTHQRTRSVGSLDSQVKDVTDAVLSLLQLELLGYK